MSSLKLENLSKNFAETIALSDINLEIPKGAFCVVLGPSGCGKSTLLNLIAGLERPSKGKIYLGEREITKLEPHKRNMAMVFQNYALYPHLSVYENIAFSLRLRREKKQAIEQKVKEASRILNIEDKLKSLPGQLSGGQRQRVATGRAIVRDPDLFLFDEPLSNLDARLRAELRVELLKLHRQIKKTMIYVTHDQTEAMALGDLVVLLKEGQIQQAGSPRDLYDDPKNIFVAGFMGTPQMNLIEFTVKYLSGKFQLCKGDSIFNVDDELRQKFSPFRDKNIFMGFRPSAVKLNRGGGINGEVVVVEALGDDSYLRLNFGSGIEITVKAEGSGTYNPGQAVPVEIDKHKIYLFDSQGSRI
ncbi:ABC transporter ATP-binding protein [Candidatus Omnitrophota bacterium]